MTWRGPKTAASRDPLLHGKAWRAIRKHWLTVRQPCARCHRPIDYDGPQYLIIRGRKRQNPRYLVVGHIVSRYKAKRMGWTEAQINALSSRRQAMVAIGEVLYAARMPDGSIKIGHTTNLLHRFYNVPQAEMLAGDTITFAPGSIKLRLNQ